MRSTLMVFIQNQKPPAVTASFCQSSQRSILISACHPCSRCRARLVFIPGRSRLPRRALACSCLITGASGTYRRWLQSRARAPANIPDAQHKSNFTHCQASSLTLIRIARGARFGVIAVI